MLSEESWENIQYYDSIHIKVKTLQKKVLFKSSEKGDKTRSKATRQERAAAVGRQEGWVTAGVFQGPETEIFDFLI